LKHRVVICGKKEMQLRSRNQQQPSEIPYFLALLLTLVKSAHVYICGLRKGC
jgi:hypothetical protein